MYARPLLLACNRGGLGLYGAVGSARRIAVQAHSGATDYASPKVLQPAVAARFCDMYALVGKLARLVAPVTYGDDVSALSFGV